jgi:hypothetical protein
MLGQHSIRYGGNFTLLPRAYQSANLNRVCRAQENTRYLINRTSFRAVLCIGNGAVAAVPGLSHDPPARSVNGV